ncbi:MAG: class I SAM-dependent methyltransferase [Parachlamydiales bacterium]
MKFVLSALLLATSIASAHTFAPGGEGCLYPPMVLEGYERSLGGPDRLVFFDSYVAPFIEDGKEQALCDMGCGAGQWALFAARKGCRVYAVDYQPELIERAVAQVGKVGLLSKVSFSVDSVANLPYRNELFDRAVSLMVGAKLPRAAFARHFREIARTLKKDGEAIIGAPTSYGIVFSNGSKSDGALLEEIHDVLAGVDAETSDEMVVEALSRLSSVIGATFAYREGKLYLVTDESRLAAGQPIWRKVAGGVVPSIYYSEADYLKQLEGAGLAVIETVRPIFSSEGQMSAYNACHTDKLGAAYLKHPPYVLYHVQKKAKMKLASDKKESAVKRYWSNT